MKKILHKILKWIFAEELQKLKQQTEDLDKKIEVIKEYQYRLKEMNITMDSYRKSIENILGNIDISVDIHQYSRS
jgi:DNA/RNA-binding domain of Phe-tRNA-synthetase-like protein